MGHCRILVVMLVAAFMTLAGIDVPEPSEGDSAPIIRDDPHPRRYYEIYREIIQGGIRSDDVGVYDPLRKTPQYDPRIPY